MASTYARDAAIGRRAPVPAHLWLGLILLVALAVRAAMLLLLDEPVQSDGLAYFTMAESLAGGGPLVDPWGQHAFYSPGYPLLLAGFFAGLGAKAGVAQLVNLLLSALSTWLVFALGSRLSGKPVVGLVAALGVALWIPSAVGVEHLQKENLSIPLLLAFTLALLRLAAGERRVAMGFAAGLAYGASLLVGASVILTASAALVALWLLWRRDRRVLGAATTFLIGTAALVGPWVAHVDRAIGHPALGTNGPFNLYLGNNPAATGWFVGIQDTPRGATWERLRAERGEYGSAQVLGEDAKRWIAANPGKASALAVRKLAYFWLPNVPDAADAAASPAIAAARWLDVAQYLLILAGVALAAALVPRERRGHAMLVALVILSFWLVHAGAYIIPRYRDPVMPLMIVLAGWGAFLLAARKGYADAA